MRSFAALLLGIGFCLAAPPSAQAVTWNLAIYNKLEVPIQILHAGRRCWHLGDFAALPTIQPGDSKILNSASDNEGGCFFEFSDFLIFTINDGSGVIAHAALIFDGHNNACYIKIIPPGSRFEPVAHTCKGFSGTMSAQVIVTPGPHGSSEAWWMWGLTHSVAPPPREPIPTVAPD